MAPALGTLSWSTRFSRRPGSRRDSVLKFNRDRDIPYFTLCGILRDPLLQRDVPALLSDVSGLREAVCRYYSLLGPSKTRLDHLANFLRSGRCLDDASLFNVVQTLTNWKGQLRGPRRDAILALVPVVSHLGSEPRATTGFTVAGVSSAVWLLSKYGGPSELIVYLDASESPWTRSSWAARQVAAATPLLADSDRQQIEDRIIRSGLMEALRVLANLDQLRRLSSLDAQLQSYLLHPHTDESPYPLPKAIVARVVLRSRLNRKEKVVLRNSLRELIPDPSYLELIRRRG